MPLREGAAGSRTPRTPARSTKRAQRTAFEQETSSGLLGAAKPTKEKNRLGQLLDRLIAKYWSHEDLIDDGERIGRWCPEEEAGLLSHLFFAFANSLVAKGARKHLEQHDLWDTAHQDEPAKLWASFEQHLNSTATPTAPQGMLFRSLLREHGHVFAVTGGIKLLHDCIMFCQPYILEQLLHHLTTNADKWMALGLSFALLGAAVLEALTVNVYFNMLFRMSLHMKAQLLEMIYRKSLRISSAVKSAMGVGPIVNLQSNDAAKLWTTPTYAHMIWNGPFQIIVVMALLVRVLTVWPALAGLGVTIAIIPVTFLLGKLLAAARREGVAAADQRIKLITEVITGIKAIKLYAWEEPYLTRISALRETELTAIRRTQLLTMINSSVFNTAPVLVSLAAFGVYAALGHSLTAAVAFPSLALFNLLRFPIYMIPQQIMNLIAAFVGIARIQKFMNSEEMAGVCHLEGCSKPITQQLLPNHDNSNHSKSSSSKGPTTPSAAVADGVAANGVQSDVGHLADQQPVVMISNGSFAWAADASPVLRNIRCDVPRGALVIVVGPVGSGKSSLLNAVLGEMAAVGDSSSSSSSSGSGSGSSPVTVTGSVAYTAQDPWIQNATLRNNVLMGLAYDEGCYQRTIDACCLEPDLQMLPAGDASEIGEKGLNLSGGQKHRVALARAVYAAADVYLLDDPLSAVDVHVGRHIFERCICGELADKTRLLVTHQLQYLPRADLVVVMLDGSIAHMGTYQQLTQQGVDLAAFVPMAHEAGEEAEQQGDGGGGGAAAAGEQPPCDAVVMKDLLTPEPEQHQQPQPQQQQQQQQQQQSPAESAAVAATTGPGKHRSRPTLADLKAGTVSFSGKVMELPSYLSPYAPSGGSFASHKPIKLGDAARWSTAAADVGLEEQPEEGPSDHITGQQSASASGTLQQQQQHNIYGAEAAATMTAVADAEAMAVPKSPVATAGAAAAAAAAVGAAAPAAGASDAQYHCNSTDDDEENEGASLMRRSVHSSNSGLLPKEGSIRAGQLFKEGSLKASQLAGQLFKHGSLTGSQKDEGSVRSGQLYRIGDRASRDGGSVNSFNSVQQQQQQQQDVKDVEATAAAAAAAGSDSKPGRGKASKWRLVKAEERAKGQVKRSVYMAYLTAWGPLLLLPIAVTFGALIERGLQVLQNYVLSAWSNATSKAQNTAHEPLSGYDTRFYLLLYFVLGLGSVAVVLGRSALLVMGSIAASRKLHRQLLAKMLRLPMSFYDSQPTGRLINRFTKDTEALDIQMSAAVNSALTCLVGALLSIVVVVVVSPYTILALIPLGLLYYRVQRLYIATSRELKRLDALAFSPIFQHYGESLTGLATIRAFGRQQLFADTNRVHIEQSNRAWWPIQLLNRWLSIRLELTGAFVVFICAVAVGVLAPRNAGLAGLALTSALNLTGTLAWMVRQTTELEVMMNSVERLVEYRTQPEEAAAITQPRPPASWPESGAVQAVQLVVRYRPELPPVLKGLSFSINAREKVGICGRTGCGKSTLMMVLFRMVEPCGGAIIIDGLDSSKLSLTDLRSRLSLVPQDPVIFSGTVRSNLDPFGQAGSDAAIWEALRQAGIDGLVRSLGAGLDSPIQEGGNNLSSGQRQLLCMARALLRSSRILVLDEATSNVDQATDQLIQTTIRTAFSHCTVLTIAHRLHTIADADRVMVLDAGQLVEFDSPVQLMARSGGVFRGLMDEAARHHHTP